MAAPLRRSVAALLAACPILLAAAPAHALTGGTGPPPAAPTAPPATHNGRPVSGPARRLPAGNLILRLSGVDARGHPLRGSLQASAAHVVTVAPPQPPASSGTHTFPLLGSGWSFGGAGGRFGAPRNGHTHQGQDIL